MIYKSEESIGRKFAPMKRERREYDRPLGELQHWQGIYKLPRIVRRALRRPLGPLLMSGRRKTIVAADALLTLIGRYHTSPRTFAERGCGIGEDGGFCLDRRGLSGQSKAPEGCDGETYAAIWNHQKPAPPGCDSLTEWGVREATQFLLGADIIERITPYAMNASTDKNGRSGFWLKAKRVEEEFGEKKIAPIKAPPIRYRLTRLYRALFSKALGLSSPPKVSSVKPPVGEIVVSSYSRSFDGELGVSTGGIPSRPSRTLEEWLNLAPMIREEIEAAEAAKRKKAYVEDLKARAARRPFNGLDRLPF